MGIFDIFKKSEKPYKEDSSNLIYDLLFCDDLLLYKRHTQGTINYPWSTLFSEENDHVELEKVVNDPDTESRIKVLAYNKLASRGAKFEVKELLAIIVEVGLDDGLDTLAVFRDNTARYINHSGKIAIWEAKDDQFEQLVAQLFAEGKSIVNKIGPWDKQRKQFPAKGNVRITFLVSDGLYFGEGPIKVLFNDQLAGPALATATRVMKYIIEKGLQL